MTDSKRRSSNALPLRSGEAATGKRQGSAPSSSSQNVRHLKLEAERVREKLQKSIIDNPQAAKKAAMLIAMWIEGKEKKLKKAG